MAQKMTLTERLVLRSFFLAFTAFAGSSTVVLAQTAVDQIAVQPSTSESAPVNVTGEAPTGSVQELQQLLSHDAVESVRSTTNGSYNAQLLFDRQTATYYAALLQQGKVWRVAKGKDEDRVSTVYRSFTRRTEQLSVEEMHRTQLEAQKTQAEQRLALIQERESRLQADLNVAHEQAALAANREQEAREQVKDLRAQRDATQTKLVQTQLQVKQLQNQVNAGLPAEHRGHRVKRENRRRS